MRDKGQFWQNIEDRPLTRRIRNRVSMYQALADELLLRLERTSRDREIVVTFYTPEQARAAQRGLLPLFNRLRGNGVVSVAVIDNCLHVRRNSKWPGKPVAKLPDE